MKSPLAKIGIVLGGFVAAFVLAGLAISLRQHFTQGPDAQAASGMYAFGDFLLGVGVFGLLALVPLGVALYWLRPVPMFWSALAWSAVVGVGTGVLALLINMANNTSTNNLMLVTHARIGLMPLIALALVTCGCFAPQSRYRGMLLLSGIVEGLIFAGIVLVKFILPNLHR